MSTPTDRLPPYGTVDDPWHGARVGRREPPGEAFPPVNPLLGRVDSLHAHAPRPRDVLMDVRRYVGLIAQRTAPINEQLYQPSNQLAAIVLPGAATPLDIDLGQVPQGIFVRAHRLMVMGTAADTPSVSLYSDGFALGNALAAFSFAAGKLGALDADGVGMAEPRDLNLPANHRLIARVRGAAGPFWIGLFTRSFAA